MMKAIYQYDDYKPYVLDLVESQPNKGRGYFQKMATHLGIGPVTISQVFKGTREVTAEQAVELSEMFGHTPLESRYFLILVQLARAGSHKLKQRIKLQLQELRTQAQELKTRVPQDAQMDEQAKAVFYSAWHYSGVRILTSIDEFNSVDQIARRLGLSRPLVDATVNFLLRHGLCLEDKGRIQIGPKKTHLEANSPFVARHHTNWRLKAIERMPQPSGEDLFYTGPMSLSADDIVAIREELAQIISRIVKRVSDSPSEELACLNIDWFKIPPPAL